MKDRPYRSTYCQIVDSGDYQALTADARAVFWNLKYAPENTWAGIFVMHGTDALVARSGLRRHRVLRALACLEEHRWIVREGPVVWIRNQLRHDPGRPFADRNKKRAIERYLETLPRLPIVQKYCDYYRMTSPLGSPPTSPPGSPSPSPSPSPPGNPDSGRVRRKSQTESECVESKRPEPRFALRCTSGAEYRIPEDQIAAWAETFPAVDIEGEIRRAIAWLDANPAKRKTARGAPRFLVNWFSRAQDRGGSSTKSDPDGTAQPPPEPNRKLTPEEKARFFGA